MPDPAPFLAAIAANPDDDLPRLVYADWLDEHGDPDRAEFIRLQCHTARVGPLDPSWAPAKLREFDLFKANEAKWRPPCEEGHLLRYRWKRGFPSCVDLMDVATGRLTDGEWCNGSFHLMSHLDPPSIPWPVAASVRELLLNNWGPSSAPLLKYEPFRTVQSITLVEWWDAVGRATLENFLAELAALPAGTFPALTTLHLTGDELTLPALISLSEVPALQTVRRLSLSFTNSYSRDARPDRFAATLRLFEVIGPRVEQLSLNGLSPELVPAFSEVAWPRLRSLIIRHIHEDGLSAYDFSNTPSLESLMILHEWDTDRPSFAQNSLQAFDDGWPEASLKVLALGKVPVEELRPWLAYPERFSLDLLSVDVKGRRLRMDELNNYPLTRGLKGLAGSFTNSDLAPLSDSRVLPELHTIWSGDTKLLPRLRWQGSTRTVIPKDGSNDPRDRPSRGSWCGWGDLFS